MHAEDDPTADDHGEQQPYDDAAAAAAEAGADAGADAEFHADAGVDGDGGAASAAAAAAAASAERGSGAASAVPASDDGLPFHVQDQVVWLGKYRGEVKFVGSTEFAPDLWIGVHLDRPVGKNDGSVQGVRYFEAQPLHGIFLRPDALKPYNEEEWAATTISSHWRGYRTHRSGASLHGGDAAAAAAADAGNAAAQAAAAAAAAAGDLDGDAGTAARVAAAEAAADAAVKAAAAAALASPPKAGLKGSASASSVRTASSSSSHTAAGPNGATTKTTRNTTTTTFVSSTRRNQVVSTPAPRTLGTSASAGAIPPRSPAAARTPAAAASPLHPYAGVATAAERDRLAADAAYFPAAAASGSNASSRAGSPSQQLRDMGNHKIWVWGDNEKGELSIQPPKKNAVLPTELRYPGNAPLAQVSLGLRHTVALNTNNEVFTAGEWVLGCLGHGDAVRHDLNTLKRLKRIGGNQPVPSAAANAAAAEDDGAAAAAAAAGVIDPAVRIVQVSCGDTHCVALYATGELYTWGGTLYGKLGSTGAELKNKKVVRVDCGNWHTAVCTDKGHVYTFGGGSKNFNFGQLGHGELNDAKSARKFKECPNPTLVQYFVTNKINVKDICCGGFHTLALTDNGDVYAWGKGEYGQLGFGTDSNHSIPKLNSTLQQVGKIAAISAGENHSLAATVTGDLYSWGYGLQGQLGHASGKSEKLPRLVQTLHASRVQIVQVACGWRHSIALSNDLEVYCWGYGDRGQLGLGDHANKLVPSVVEALRGKAIRQIAAGGSHSLAANFQFQTTTDIYRLLEEWRARALDKERAAAAAAEAEAELLEHKRQAKQPPPPLRSPAERKAPPPKPPAEPLAPPPQRPAPAASPLPPLEQLSPLQRNPNDRDAFIDDLGPDLSRASGGPGPADTGRRVKVVWSDSLALVHKFATFQSLLPYAQFESLMHGFIKRCYAHDPEAKFDDIVVTRPKVRTGVTRVTLMFVGPPAYRDLGPLHSYWPEWARAFWQLVMDERLCEFPAGADMSAHVPVFRELRPMAEKQRILRDRAAAGLPVWAIDDLKAEGAELNWFNADAASAALLTARQPQIEAAVHRAAAGDAYFVLNKPNYAAVIDGAPPQYAVPAAAGSGAAGRSYVVPSPAAPRGGANTAAPPSYAAPLQTSGAAGGAAAPSRAQSTIAAARAHLSQSKAASAAASPAGTPRAAATPGSSGSGAATASPGGASSGVANRKTTTTTTTTITTRVIKTPISGAAAGAAAGAAPRPGSTARPT